MAQLLMVNPRRRKAKRAVAKTKRRSGGLMARASSTLSRVRRKYRRNPISAKGAMTQFQDGAIGAAGALAVDIVMSKLPLPDNLKTGLAAPVVQGFVGIGVGMAIAKFGKNRRLGQQMAQGAVTVSLYNAGRKMLAPSLGLAGYDDSGMLGYDDSGMLGYSDLGWYSPAQTSEPYYGGSDAMNGFDDFED